MAPVPGYKQHEPPLILWGYCDKKCKVFRIVVTAESDKSLWIPHLRAKKALPTFHSFDEAKTALIDQINARIRGLKGRPFHKFYAKQLKQAQALKPPSSTKATAKADA